MYRLHMLNIACRRNKVDLIREAQAEEHQQQIAEFVKGVPSFRTFTKLH